MKYLIRILLLIIIQFIIIQSNLFAEEDYHDHYGKNEFSGSIGIIPEDTEGEIATGYHLHYIRFVDDHNIWGVGLSTEAIFANHTHYGVAALINYRIWAGLSIIYLPGVKFEIEENGTEIEFGQHIDIIYEFEIGDFHIGPVLGFEYEESKLIYLIGVHVGIGF